MSEILFSAKSGISKIVEAPKGWSSYDIDQDTLELSELFYDTIQGEGATAGKPAIFLRLGGCPMNCEGCDTKSVWNKSERVSTIDLTETIYANFRNFGATEGGNISLVLTGGSALRQQGALHKFLLQLKLKLGMKYKRLFIELENECYYSISEEFSKMIDQINNSPKLSFWVKDRAQRYHPEAVQSVAIHKNSWFKFVIKDEGDWAEIEFDYLLPKLIHRNQVMLMPFGEDRKTLEKNRHKVLKVATREAVRYSDRLHIIFWDRKESV